MSSYAYNNDLVGKNKPWGEKKDLDKVRKSIYNRYMLMCHRCNDEKDCRYSSYGGDGIENHFTSFSQFYNALKSQTHGSMISKSTGKTIVFYSWDEFKMNPDMYHIDKDHKHGHGSPYAPDTILIVSKGDNISESEVRSHSRKVVLDGVVYESLKEAASHLGCSHGNLGYHLDGTPWRDRKGVTHTVKYL